MTLICVFREKQYGGPCRKYASPNESDFEGFTPEDVIKAIEKGAQLKQIDDVDLSLISFDEDDGDQIMNETPHVFSYLINIH
jgi:hypothetical protein